MSIGDRVIRFLMAPLIGISFARGLVYFAEESNWGMVSLMIMLVCMYIVLLINTWHN